MKLRRSLLLAIITSMTAAFSVKGQQAAAPAAPARAAAPAAAAAPQTKMGSRVFKWEDMQFATKAQGATAPVVNLPTPTFQIFESHVTTLNPGQLSHAQHKHDREEIIILKEGTVEVNINDKPPVRVGAGALFFFAANDLHNVKNVGTTPATYWVLNFTTGLTASRTDQPGATVAAVPGKLVSTVWSWESLQAEVKPTGFRRGVVDSPTLTMNNFEAHVTTLNGGQAPHAAHSHPDEEIIVVREGQMEVTINGVSQRAGPGSIFFYASNDSHGMKNVGTTPATYYVMRIVTDATPKGPARVP